MHGLAFDRKTNTLYGVDSFLDQLIIIDVITGAGTSVAPLGPFVSIEGLAFDANTNTIYGADAKTGVLFTIDPASGATAIVGQVVGSWASSHRRIVGLAFDPNTTTLYGSMDGLFSDSELITIDLESGVHTVVGSFEFGVEMRDLAFDPQSQTLFGVGSTASSDNRFFTIDVATGIAQLTGATSTHAIIGLAFDSNTGWLYGTYALNSSDAALVTIDPATGRTSSVGPLGRWRDARGLAFDSHMNTLFGAGSGDIGTDQQQLITIDTNTGASTPLRSFGFRLVSDLAFDENTGVLYGSSWPSLQLLTIDMATGIGTAVGPLGGFGLDGLPLGFISVGGLAFNSRTNTLYGSDTGNFATDQ
ncbi:MAG: hypothetical protein IIC63_05725, partial [Proteobacteria bacterium]|nr:hypothetical protein [Pseudomonadota bacterium]